MNHRFLRPKALFGGALATIIWSGALVSAGLSSASSSDLNNAFGAVCEDCAVNEAACIADSCKETAAGSGIWVQKIGTNARHGYSFEVGAGKPGLNQPAVVNRPKDCITTKTCSTGSDGKSGNCSDCGPGGVEQVTTYCLPQGKYCQN